MSELFISHSSRDDDLARMIEKRLGARDYNSIFLDFDPDQGIPAGQSWERTIYRKLRACDAIIAILSDAYLASQWCFAELALARMERKPVFALKTGRLDPGARLPSILLEHQYIDFRTEEEDPYERLCAGLRQAHIVGGIKPEWDGKRPPYPGLDYFDERDESIHFGREEETKVDCGRTTTSCSQSMACLRFEASGSIMGQFFGPKTGSYSSQNATPYCPLVSTVTVEGDPNNGSRIRLEKPTMSHLRGHGFRQKAQAERLVVVRLQSKSTIERVFKTRS